MRRRRLHPLVAWIVIGCGGPPEPAPGTESPSDPTVAEPVGAADTSGAASGLPDSAGIADSTPRGPVEQPSADPADADGPWNEARARGVDFRATGQEPGWFLEIDDDASILFAYDYGTERTSVPTPAPYRDEDAGRLTYRAAIGTDELVVIIEVEPCFDSMSGEAFDRTVTVSLGAREYRGCGRVL